MSTELVQRCSQVSKAYGDSPITSYFRQLVAERTGTIITEETSKLLIRQLILDFEQQMAQAISTGDIPDKTDSFIVKHQFADGAYSRECHIAAGSIVVGKIHRHQHFNYISKGRVTVMTEEGGIEELCAGQTLVSPAGVKRLLIAHEDTIWTVFHVTTERDPDKIEELVIAKDYSEFPVALEHKEGI